MMRVCEEAATHWISDVGYLSAWTVGGRPEEVSPMIFTSDDIPERGKDTQRA
jgi:hypothetical protein